MITPAASKLTNIDLGHSLLNYIIKQFSSKEYISYDTRIISLSLDIKDYTFVQDNNNERDENITIGSLLKLADMSKGSLTSAPTLFNLTNILFMTCCLIDIT